MTKTTIAQLKTTEGIVHGSRHDRKIGRSPDHRYLCVMNQIYGSPSYLHDL